MKSIYENKIYFTISLLLIIISLFIFKIFINGIIWGGIISLSVWPYYEKIKNNKYNCIKNNKILIFILTMILSILLLAPFIYVVNELSNSYENIIKYINNNKDYITPPNFIKTIPYSDYINQLWLKYISNSQAFIKIVNNIETLDIFKFFNQLWNIIINWIITIFTMIVSFYYIMKNGNEIKNNYEFFFNKTIGEKSINYINNAIESLRGTINGIVFIGFIEGIILSVPLILGELHFGLIIGITAGLLGVIPTLMPILMVPSLIYIYFTNNHLIAISGFIILILNLFFVENFIKPQIISKKVKINSLIILISMIGGMQLLGPVGLFTGPAIVSISISVLKDFLTKK